MNSFYLPKNIWLAVVLLLFSCILFFSCTPEDKATAPAAGFSKVYKQEPVTVTMLLNRTEITIAEQLELTLLAAAPEEYEVKLPSHTTTLGDFSVDDFHTSPPRLTGTVENTRLVVQKKIILEPYLPGTYTIPALKIVYQGKGDEAVTNEIFTDEVEILVSSFLPDDAGDLQIKDIRPPQELPLDIARLAWLAGIFGSIIILVLAGFIYWRKTHAQKEDVIIQVNPDEIAFRELDKLMTDDLLTRGEVKLFHLRISDILRRYIENRFGLKAPERTTEEFLAELTQDRQMQKALLGDHKRLLGEFLNQCDLVKFAKHEPSIDESGKTVVICREFIEETRKKRQDPRVQGVEGPREN